MAEIEKKRASFTLLQCVVWAALLGTVGAFLVVPTISPWLGERAAGAINVGIVTGVVLFFYTWRNRERPLRESVMRCLAFTVLFTPTNWGLLYALEVMRS